MGHKFHYLLLSFLLGLGSYEAQAQHSDVLLQVVDGQIVSGAANFNNNTWLIGQKVFERQLLTNFRANDPGFSSLETGNPLLEGGVSGFSPNVDVLVDVVPSTIDGVWANFWYWDGVDPLDDGFTVEDVSFGAAPAGVTWNVFDIDFNLFTADGSETTVPDILVQESFFDGAIHSHLLVQVANSGSTPPEGVYLASMVAHSAGLEDSEPIFFVHRTAGLTNEPRDVAAEWVRDNYDSLIGVTEPGDFNGDGTVNGTDFLTWQRDQGSPEELITWQTNYGLAASAAQGAAVAIPEPTAIVLLITGWGVFAGRRLRRRLPWS